MRRAPGPVRRRRGGRARRAGLLAAAAELGLDVPGDLSVIGFDDITAAATARPPLTTIRQSHRDKGRHAAELLLRGGTASEAHVLPTELVVRASTGLRSHRV